jgi:tRNA A-37 threonylcarbamoyl transferase component Bud32
MTDVWVGKTLSKVQIQQLIGRGGMADVYLGRHTTLNVPRAVKILHGHLVDDPDLKRRFDEEAKAVASLRHPNIVQVYDLDLYEGQPYIVMELLQGMSMSAYLKGLHQLGHSLPYPSISRLLDSLGSALDYAHSRGIVHRDIKPANVILRQGATPVSPSLPLPADATAILTDFGIAHISGATSQTLTGTILGTPAYMSPEQVRGEPADARSDTYSMGIMLYEMLAGTLPFDPEVDTTASVLYKQANVVPAPLPNVSPRIQDVVAQALQKDRKDRFQRTGDLAAAFRDAITAGQTTVASRKPTDSQGQEPRRRIPALWIGAGVVAILLCAVVVGAAGLAGVFSRGAVASPSSAAAVVPTHTAVAPPEATPTKASQAPALPAPGPISGEAVFRDSSVQVILPEIGDPGAGLAYAAWLTASDGPSIQLDSGLSQGGLNVAYADPQSRNLLGLYDGLSITLEPDPDPAPETPGTVVYQGRIDSGLQDEIRRLDTISRGAPTIASLIEGLRSQATTHDSHLGYSLAALDSDNLEGAKGHAEHTINVLVGEASPDFGDWDGNKRAENPGDGFGLIAYAALAKAFAESELADPQIAPDTASALQQLIQTLDDLTERSEAAVRLAQRIASADSLDEARTTAESWSADLLSEPADAAASMVQASALRLWVPMTPAP